MRRLCILGALLVIVVANGWGVWQSIRNKTEPRGGTLQLTERELPLETVAFDSSVTLLRLEWRTERAGDRRFGPAAWLDGSKLAELGFDCSVPLDSPQAPRHYSSTPARRAFLVLEHQSSAVPDPAARGKDGTGLVVIDADQSAGRLRERYADPAKHSICRGVVRIALRRHDADGGLLSAPRLEGWIAGLTPSQISVSQPLNGPLARFRRTSEETGKTPAGEPRFSARVRWGKNYEPWVENVRTLSASPH